MREGLVAERPWNQTSATLAEAEAWHQPIYSNPSFFKDMCPGIQNADDPELSI
jgi:hypothetical protein